MSKFEKEIKNLIEKSQIQIEFLEECHYSFVTLYLLRVGVTGAIFYSTSNFKGAFSLEGKV